MAIDSLSTLPLSTFKGGKGLIGRGAGSLVAILNDIIGKVNSMIDDMNAGVFDVLDVGSGTGQYYGSSDSWLEIDGTNPPTLSAFRIQDQADGSFGTVTNTSGTLSVA